MPNLFAGVTSPIAGADIVTNGMSLVTAVGPIVLIGLAIVFAPKLISVVRRALGK